MSNEILYEVTPYGGVGQIGSNMTVIKTDEKWIIIDIGVLFPKDDLFDLNYLIPDFSDLDDEKTTDLFITHGHEDHIGAISHLLERLPRITVWAPAFAFELIRKKLNDRKTSCKINIYVKNKEINLGPLAVTPVEVNHSIPDTFGLIIQDTQKITSLLYLSDVKYDETNHCNKVIDFKKIQNITAPSKKRLLFLDSTNILKHEKNLLEEDLIFDFDKIIKAAKGAIYATLFASNNHRIQTLINLAIKNNKKLVFLGRAIKYYTDIGVKLGHLKNLDKVLVDEDSVRDRRDNLIILLSGSQGDFKSSARNVIFGNNKRFKIDKNDIVIFSSKIIPGNERKVLALYDEVAKRGAKIYTDKTANIHASGHAGREGLKTIIDLYAPDYITPVHGSAYFVRVHQEFVKEKFPKIDCKVLFNFDTLIVKEDQVKIEKGEEKQPILIHGKDLSIDRSDINKRRKMASTGHMIVAIRKESKPHNSKVELRFLGLPSQIINKELELQQLVMDLLMGKRKADNQSIEENIRIYLRKYSNEILGYKPLTTVVII